MDLKRRHEDLGATVRMCWGLYIQFYTVFLTFSGVGLGWVLTRPADIMVPRAKQVIAVVFVIQTTLRTNKPLFRTRQSHLTRLVGVRQLYGQPDKFPN